MSNARGKVPSPSSAAKTGIKDTATEQGANRGTRPTLDAVQNAVLQEQFCKERRLLQKVVAESPEVRQMLAEAEEARAAAAAQAAAAPPPPPPPQYAALEADPQAALLLDLSKGAWAASNPGYIHGRSSHYVSTTAEAYAVDGAALEWLKAHGEYQQQRGTGAQNHSCSSSSSKRD